MRPGQSRPYVLITADAVGGVWQYATDLATGLVPLGYDPLIAVLGPPPSAAQRAAARDVEIVTTGLSLDWLVDGPEPVREAAETIARLADECGADIIQLNTPALAAFGGFDRPVVAVAHGCVATWWAATRGAPLDAEFVWHAEVTRLGLEAADLVVAPSAAHAGAVRQCYGLHRTPTVQHNGRRTAPACPQSAPIAAAFTAGRLWDEAKNASLLDRVAERLPVPLRAAGSVVAPHGERLQSSHMHLLGQLDDAALRAELAARPIFVSAARFEPFGLAVLEAAEAGCALVLSDIPTFRELWHDAATFVAPDDADGFVNAIKNLLDDPQHRSGAGIAAHSRAQTYTSEAMAAGMARIFAGLGVAGAAAARMAA